MQVGGFSQRAVAVVLLKLRESGDAQKERVLLMLGKSWCWEMLTKSGSWGDARKVQEFVVMLVKSGSSGDARKERKLGAEARKVREFARAMLAKSGCWG